MSDGHITSLDEYEKLSTQVVELGSGAKFLCGEFPIEIYAQFLSIMEKVKQEKKKEELSNEEYTGGMIEHYDELAKLILPAVVIEPVITKENYNKVRWMDGMTIMTSCMKIGPIALDAEEERKQFPKDKDGPNSG